MLKQRTLRQAISTKGVGLHTGARVELALYPAPADSPRIFALDAGDGSRAGLFFQTAMRARSGLRADTNALR